MTREARNKPRACKTKRPLVRAGAGLIEKAIQFYWALPFLDFFFLCFFFFLCLALSGDEALAGAFTPVGASGAVFCAWLLRGRANAKVATRLSKSLLTGRVLSLAIVSCAFWEMRAPMSVAKFITQRLRAHARRFQGLRKQTRHIVCLHRRDGRMGGAALGCDPLAQHSERLVG